MVAAGIREIWHLPRLLLFSQVVVVPEVITTSRVSAMLLSMDPESMPIGLDTRSELAPISVVASRRRSALDLKKETGSWLLLQLDTLNIASL